MALKPRPARPGRKAVPFTRRPRSGGAAGMTLKQAAAVAPPPSAGTARITRTADTRVTRSGDSRVVR